MNHSLILQRSLVIDFLFHIVSHTVLAVELRGENEVYGDCVNSTSPGSPGTCSTVAVVVFCCYVNGSFISYPKNEDSKYLYRLIFSEMIERIEDY